MLLPSPISAPSNFKSPLTGITRFSHFLSVEPQSRLTSLIINPYPNSRHRHTSPISSLSNLKSSYRMGNPLSQKEGRSGRKEALEIIWPWKRHDSPWEYMFHHFGCFPKIFHLLWVHYNYLILPKQSSANYKLGSPIKYVELNHTSSIIWN